MLSHTKNSDMMVQPISMLNIWLMRFKLRHRICLCLLICVLSKRLGVCVRFCHSKNSINETKWSNGNRFGSNTQPMICTLFGYKIKNYHFSWLLPWCLCIGKWVFSTRESKCENLTVFSVHLKREFNSTWKWMLTFD